MKKVKIGKKYFNVKKTIRSLFIFEQITKRPFSVNSMLDNYLLIYCAVIANNPDADLSWEQFIDELDKDNTLMQRLNEALLEDKIDKLISEGDEPEEGDKEKKG